MTSALTVSPWSLTLSVSLVLVAMAISSKEKLGLNRDIITAMVRMVIQLIIVGFVLTYIFQVNSVWVTGIVMIVMLVNAAWNAGKRAQAIPNAFRISLVSILGGVLVAILVLVLSGSLQFVPTQMIPITGMLVGNAMNVLGLCYRNLNNLFKAEEQAVLEKLALGATTKQASRSIMQEAIRGSLQPTVDSAKTVGLVTLPGMMTGLMFAGIVPTQAIMYQIMVYFMIMATAAISSVIAVYLSYQTYYNKRGQLLVK